MTKTDQPKWAGGKGLRKVPFWMILMLSGRDNGEMVTSILLDFLSTYAVGAIGGFGGLNLIFIRHQLDENLKT